MTLTTDQCVQALLGRGYFPKELPPPFHSHAFAEKVVSIRTSWASLKAAMNSSTRSKHPLPSHPVLFDMARKGHARRTLAIPNAVNQFYLVEEIAKHWAPITALIESSVLSITKCAIATEGRAISIPPLSSLADKRIIIYAAQGAILQTDVLSFYHSLYTHAIPWALHGKAITKANRNPKDLSVFGNRIDALVRSCQDGQTIGIPVGPDTSRIISELLLCAVEKQIPKRLNDRISGGLSMISFSALIRFPTLKLFWRAFARPVSILTCSSMPPRQIQFLHLRSMRRPGRARFQPCELRQAAKTSGGQ